MPKSNGHHTFTEAEIAQYQARHSIGSKARLALAIGIFTGLRREDATRLGRGHFRDGVLTIRPKKTETTTAVTVTIPVLPEFQTILDATPAEHLTLLTTERGKSYNRDAFSHQFREWCTEAGLPKRCTFHGLRKACLTRLADAGCTPHEIMAISGHSSLAEVERYTKAADRVRNARAAMARQSANGSGRAV